MKKHPTRIPAATLSIYERAVAAYPHLRHVKDAMHFCQQLCLLKGVETITVEEYWIASAVAVGNNWEA